MKQEGHFALDHSPESLSREEDVYHNFKHKSHFSNTSVYLWYQSDHNQSLSINLVQSKYIWTIALSDFLDKKILCLHVQLIRENGEHIQGVGFIFPPTVAVKISQWHYF